MKWVVVPFNSSYAPGSKTFDFDINQIGISPERAQAVDFSDGYYAVQQVVIALKDSTAATAKSVADLKELKLGAQVGTTASSTSRTSSARRRAPRSTTTPTPRSRH